MILGGGVDSIPSDLGAFIAAGTLLNDPNQKVQIRSVYTRYTGSFSGGTLNSARASARGTWGPQKQVKLQLHAAVLLSLTTGLA